MTVIPHCEFALRMELAWSHEVPASRYKRNDVIHGALSSWPESLEGCLRATKANNVGGIQDESGPESETQPEPGPTAAGQSARPETRSAAGRRAEAWPAAAAGSPRTGRPAPTGPEPLTRLALEMKPRHLGGAFSYCGEYALA